MTENSFTGKEQVAHALEVRACRWIYKAKEVLFIIKPATDKKELRFQRIQSLYLIELWHRTIKWKQLYFVVPTT